MSSVSEREGSGERVTCTAHGLVFDPSIHRGCVICRREAGETPARGGERGAAGGVASTRPDPSGSTAAVARAGGGTAEPLRASGGLIFAGGALVFVLAAVSSARRSGEFGTDILASGLMAVVLVGLGLVFRRGRSMAGVGAVLAATGFLILVSTWTRGASKEGEPAAATGAEATFPTRGGLAEVTVPAGWRVFEAGDPTASLTLQSSDGRHALVVTHVPVAQLDGSMTEAQRFAVLADAVARTLGTRREVPTEESMVFGLPGHTVELRGEKDGTSFVGVFAAARQLDTIHTIYFIAEASEWDALRPVAYSTIARAVLR